MASKGDIQARKSEYFGKVQRYFNEYTKVFLVGVDNVGSQQMHTIRKNLRGEAVVLLGKNTMMRKAMRPVIADQPELEKLLAYVRGNIGFVFTNGDLKEVRTKILAERVAAPAKAGAIAPCDVHVKAVNTGMEPGKTSFFQALGIPTKISRGTIEIINDVHLIKAGAKVGASEAALLNMLNISPFTYGMNVLTVYDNGQVYEPEILDISEEHMMEQLQSGIKAVAALSMALGVTTKASVAHSIVNGFKNLLAIALTSDEISFKQADKVKEMLKNPSAFAAPAAAAAAPAAGAKKAEAAAPAEEKDESDADMGFGLFD